MLRIDNTFFTFQFHPEFEPQHMVERLIPRSRARGMGNLS
jgi:GMP synthase-like glutamine amidotransferase